MHTQEWKLYPSSQLSLLPPIPSPSLTCCCGSSRLNAYPYDDDDDDNNIDALLTAAVPVIVDDKAAYYPLPPPLSTNINEAPQFLLLLPRGPAH